MQAESAEGQRWTVSLVDESPVIENSTIGRNGSLRATELGV
jgi:hypothetical protein